MIRIFRKGERHTVKYFWPDWYFEDFQHIPEGFFKENGIRYLICDIDNTLIPYSDSLPTPPVRKFLSNLEKEGVKVAFASNNEERRVMTFAKDAGHPAVFNALKPFGWGAKKAMKKIEAPAKECAMLGDQLLTDCLAARHVGMRMILVKPIKDKDSLLFRIKRAYEHHILKRYLKHFEINDPDPDGIKAPKEAGYPHIKETE